MVFKIETVYAIVCYLATLFPIFLGISIFLKNKDVCELSFKTFNKDSLSPYPSDTLCFSNSINEKILESYGDDEIGVMS